MSYFSFQDRFRVSAPFSHQAAVLVFFITRLSSSPISFINEQCFFISGVGAYTQIMVKAIVKAEREGQDARRNTP